MASGIFSLKHANGTEVTAQEAYDAFMNSRVLIVKFGNTYEAISMEWFDNNSAKTDPTNVGYVKLSWVTAVNDTVSIVSAELGDRSLVQAQQG